MTNLYLIRHAQTAGNAEMRFQGRLDHPVSDAGKQQIKELEERMRDIPLAAIYTSPLKRALLTAQGIAAPHNLTPIIVEGLIEIDGGPFEGEKFTDLLVRYPVEFRQFIDEPHNFMGVEGGESMKAVFDRIADTMATLIAQNKGRDFAVISHGCTTHCFLKHISGYTLGQTANLGWNGHAAISHITFDDDLNPTVVKIGDDDHLSIKTKKATL